jgi:uncharacterized protein involved in exopolysaccharide biosynthesis
MSVGSFIGGSIRALLIAAATGAAAFGALVIFEPFGKAKTTPAAVTVIGTPEANALQRQIEALRISLRDTKAALDNVKTAAVSAGPSPAADLRAQYEAQIAAATERRDLALRHAAAIRESLDAGVTPSSLAEIRDSVVIGQLLSQQAALDAQIAVEGTRFKSNHPTMLALTAQRNALVTQIRREAAAIATALESEAKIDDAQIKLLDEQMPVEVAPPTTADPSTLEAKASAQRAQLDSLVDEFFNIPPATTTSQPAQATNLLSPLNMVVVGVAAAAAILFQILLALRRRPEPSPEDIEAWEEDNDPEIIVVEEEPVPLRKAS